MADETVKANEVTYNCPKCHGPMESGWVTFVSSDSLDLHWSTKKSKGWLRDLFNWSDDHWKIVSDWDFEFGKREGLRCNSCHLVTFSYLYKPRDTDEDVGDR